MENLCNRVNIEFVIIEKRLCKLIKVFFFDYFRIFIFEIVGVNLKKMILYLNCFIYVGFIILELFKVLMFDFYYNYIKIKYRFLVKLLFSDIDLLCLEVKIEDIFVDMVSDV